jgi:hypothetical protein
MRVLGNVGTGKSRSLNCSGIWLSVLHVNNRSCVPAFLKVLYTLHRRKFKVEQVVLLDGGL